MPTIATVVATYNRPGLLAKRALKSIASQSRPSDILIVVDDSDSEIRRLNRRVVDEFEGGDIQVIYLENRRTPGASGAWNTALRELQRIAPSSFVAILDDDDMWEPNYLERCKNEAVTRNLDMVATGIVFNRSGEEESLLLRSPESLAVSELLVRNPHIQGSNLFVRLSRLLEAGGFDEALRSTTDRDICIRLADLGTVRYGRIHDCLVQHYAESDRPRLSTPGSAAKIAGLRGFYRKYRARMSAQQKEAFIHRSVEVFGCDPTAVEAYGPSGAPQLPHSTPVGHLYLVVGVITSPDVRGVTYLMDSLLTVTEGRNDVTLRAVLLENGRHDAASWAALTDAVSAASGRGLDVSIIDLERQIHDVEAGVFDVTPEQMSERKSIALSRTMLQHYLFKVAKPLPGAVVWVLDDDVVLEGLASGPDGTTRVEKVDHISEIKRLKEAGYAIVLGEVMGDPPLPILSCVRTQLVDLYHNLLQLEALNPGDPYPDRQAENRQERLRASDYYYDLSAAHSDHLESPFWYEPERKGASVTMVLEEMVSRLPDILSGSQVFRPLVASVPYGTGAGIRPSLSRGPSALVFDLQALRDFPNAVPSIGGSDTRRSDMVWSLLNRFIAGRSVVQAPLPVRQNREADEANANQSMDALISDIRGHALFSSLHDTLQRKSQERNLRGLLVPNSELLNLDETGIDEAATRYNEYLEKRTHTFELNFARVRGLLAALRRFYDRASCVNTQPWWLDPAGDSEIAYRLRMFVETVESIYTQDNLDRIKQRVLRGETEPVRTFLRTLPDTVARHRLNTPLPMNELRLAAESVVTAEFRTGDLDCLGIGEEAVVLTDGRMVFKYFHYWQHRADGDRLAFLQSLAGRLTGFSSLPDIREVRVEADRLIITYPFEAGQKYAGGRLYELLKLLRECKEAGLSCRNMHPDNLLVTPSGLKLIDFGLDIVPHTGDDFEQMCRRAYLTYRFHYRSDLKRLMTRSLTDTAIPEMTGFDLFLRALEPRGLHELFYRPMAKLAAGRGNRSVLDYGCGDGRLAELLAKEGIAVTGYDPDPAAISECLGRSSPVEYGGNELLYRMLTDSVGFDEVVCGRVLCTIFDDSEMDEVLRNIRQLVSDSGEALVAVCNPLHLETKRTELGSNDIPEGKIYEDTSVYTKTVSSSCNLREEVHRSLSAYRRAFSAAGLRVREVLELEGVDTEELLPASEHLVFRLVPVPTDAPRVSLLIKTCLMEWQIIERLVRHQVRQLEEPLPFCEKIVVVDPSEGPFSRQYGEPNATAHRQAMQHLLDDGVVDRVIYAPTEPEVIRETYKRWFGRPSDKTHSANGQQLLATLYGFESCSGDYVLQLDSDLLMSRQDRDYDYLAAMVDVLQRDPISLFVGMSICNSEPVPYTFKSERGDWRVEVRGCLFDRSRLLSVLPVGNSLEDGRFTLAWHRAFDNFISASEYRSYRGGNPESGFIHVPNEHKADNEALLDIVDSVERGHIPEVQLDKVGLCGTPDDWCGPKRHEPFVFVISGRNVRPGRFKRCVESLLARESADWGAVVIDDASTNGFGEYAEMLFAPFADRVTVLRNRRRRGLLFNTWNAITNFCADPESVIITLDADDALIEPNGLNKVGEEYEEGADVTVGSMLRLDKEAHYPADFDNPRSRGSNVWQHLRTFKKYLFDSIALEDLKLDGEWIDLANDWAFMVPIIEMASNPRYIPEPLYLYEPAAPKSAEVRKRRDSIIARILENPPYRNLRR